MLNIQSILQCILNIKYKLLNKKMIEMFIANGIYMNLPMKSNYINVDTITKNLIELYIHVVKRTQKIQNLIMMSINLLAIRRAFIKSS